MKKGDYVRVIKAEDLSHPTMYMMQNRLSFDDIYAVKKRGRDGLYEIETIFAGQKYYVARSVSNVPQNCLRLIERGEFAGIKTGIL